MKSLKKHFCFNGTTEFHEHSSESTRTTMKFSTFKPEGPIRGGIIWLSGLTCTDENFMCKAGAQKYLSEHGIALICPDTSPRGLELPQEHESYDFGSGAGFYLNALSEGYKDHYLMYSYVNEELYKIFDEMFSLNGKISLMGHSMGGHGSLTIGLKNPQKYKSLSAFSPIVNPTQCPWGKKAFLGYLGNNESLWNEYDACELLKSKHSHPETILIDQGLKDEFYKEQLLTENFEKTCKDFSQKVQIDYSENYDHSYYFISTFIKKHIEHHAQYL